ncbi:MAG: SPFH domain-containing protein [Methanobacteriota archaeon]|nr:MAG: SPFH domain-containing protein [Euryarchaeota archaeon]
MILGHHSAGPSDHVIEYVRGRPVREGRGLSFLYVPRITRVVSVPLGSTEARFEFRERSSDFQRVRVEGGVVYKVANPRRAAAAIDFTVDRTAGCARQEARALLRRRVLAVARDILRDELAGIPIKEALTSATNLGRSTRIRMMHSRHLKELGVVVMAVFLKEVRGPPELAKAMEAEQMDRIALRAVPPGCDTLLVSREPCANLSDGADDVGGPAPSIECNANCPFRHMCEDFMSDVRGGKAWCTLFREFSV